MRATGVRSEHRLEETECARICARSRAFLLTQLKSLISPTGGAKQTRYRPKRASSWRSVARKLFAVHACLEGGRPYLAPDDGRSRLPLHIAFHTGFHPLVQVPSRRHAPGSPENDRGRNDAEGNRRTALH